MLLVWDWLIIVTVHCRKQVIGVRVHLLLYPSLLSLFLHCRVCNICTVCHLGPVHRPPGNTSGNVILCCPASPSELLSHDAHWAVSFYTAADTNEKVLLLPFKSSTGKRILDFLFLQAINFFCSLGEITTFILSFLTNMKIPSVFFCRFPAVESQHVCFKTQLVNNEWSCKLWLLLP